MNSNNTNESRIYAISDLIEWDNLKLLKYSALRQHNSVWNWETKSYFIDTILHSYPIPTIFIRLFVDNATGKTVREIIYGQEYAKTILEFANNQFSILKSQSRDFAGLSYISLSNEQRDNFLQFGIVLVNIDSDDETIIHDIFTRLERFR